MDANSYQVLCSKPNAFARHELQQTLDALLMKKSKNTDLLKAVLASSPLEKPPLHKGGKETDYFLVCVAANDAVEIIENLGDLEARAVSPDGYTTPEASRYASLVDRWLSYVESI